MKMPMPTTPPSKQALRDEPKYTSTWQLRAYEDQRRLDEQDRLRELDKQQAQYIKDRTPHPDTHPDAFSDDEFIREGPAWREWQKKITSDDYLKNREAWIETGKGGARENTATKEFYDQNQRKHFAPKQYKRRPETLEEFLAVASDPTQWQNRVQFADDAFSKLNPEAFKVLTDHLEPGFYDENGNSKKLFPPGWEDVSREAKTAFAKATLDHLLKTGNRSHLTHVLQNFVNSYGWGNNPSVNQLNRPINNPDVWTFSNEAKRDEWLKSVGGQYSLANTKIDPSLELPPPPQRKKKPKSFSAPIPPLDKLDQITQARDIYGNEIKAADMLTSGGVKLQKHQRAEKKPASNLQFRNIGGQVRVVGTTGPKSPNEADLPQSMGQTQPTRPSAPTKAKTRAGMR